MRLLKKIFKRNNAKAQVPFNNWIDLNSLNQIEKIKEESKLETVFIFKHSTRCIISKMVIKRFENMFDDSMNNVKAYYLDLLNYRDISDEVGATFKVTHQSPQLLIIKNEVSVFNTSHQDITNITLQDYL